VKVIELLEDENYRKDDDDDDDDDDEVEESNVVKTSKKYRKPFETFIYPLDSNDKWPDPLTKAKVLPEGAFLNDNPMNEYDVALKLNMM